MNLSTDNTAKLFEVIRKLAIVVNSQNDAQERDRMLRRACDLMSQVADDHYDEPPHLDMSPYVSEVPEGYDTVIGYMAKRHFEELDMMPDVIRDTIGYGRKCSQMCRKLRTQPRAVVAPHVCQDAGISEVRAYPLDVLDRVISA